MCVPADMSWGDGGGHFVVLHPAVALCIVIRYHITQSLQLSTVVHEPFISTKGLKYRNGT